MLTGPMFMLQVYDCVLNSGSKETLLALFILVAVLYAIMGVLDYIRGRISARIGARFQTGLDDRVFAAQFTKRPKTAHNHHISRNWKPFSGSFHHQLYSRFSTSCGFRFLSPLYSYSTRCLAGRDYRCNNIGHDHDPKPTINKIGCPLFEPSISSRQKLFRRNLQATRTGTGAWYAQISASKMVRYSEKILDPPNIVK